MSDRIPLTAGDDCPNCGGDFAPDLTQSSAALIDHHKRVAANPSASARYAEVVEEKVRAHGELHTCRGCGYQTRFGPALAAAGAGASRKGK